MLRQNVTTLARSTPHCYHLSARLREQPLVRAPQKSTTFPTRIILLGRIAVRQGRREIILLRALRLSPQIHQLWKACWSGCKDSPALQPLSLGLPVMLPRSEITCPSMLRLTSSDACYIISFPILVHHFPRNGLTRRPESPFKIILDLAQVREGLSSYDRIGSWNWLRLPPGTTTRQNRSNDGRCLKTRHALYLSG